MISEAQDIVDTEPCETGIDALGKMVVLTFGLISFALFLDTTSELFSWKIGILIVLSVAFYRFAGFQSIPGVGNLKKTLIWATIGFSALGIMSSGVAYIWSFSSTNYSVLGLVGVLALISPAVFEELLFRGAVYRHVFDLTQNTVTAIITQAFFFTLFHAWVADLYAPENLGFFSIIFMGGIILQLVYLASKNILSSILAHMGNNARGIMTQTIDSGLIVIVILVAITIYLWRKIRS